jgi:ATP-binding cassette subfamily B (MDR/TAP) protein 1
VEGKEVEKKASEEAVPLSKLYSLADRSDMPYFYLGVVAALVTGVGMPASIFLFGNAIDSFSQLDPAALNHMVTTIKKISLIFVCIGTGIWVTSYIYFTFLLVFSQKVIKKVRMAYLKAILEQDIAWFDSINP